MGGDTDGAFVPLGGEYDPATAILEATRSLMNHQAVLNTERLGPMLEVHTTTTNNDASGRRDGRLKTYAVVVDYDVALGGTRRVKVHVLRSTRWGLPKCSTLTIPEALLGCFEDTDELTWRSVHLPILRDVILDTRAVPEAFRDPYASVWVSKRISHMPPMRRECA